MKLLSPAISRLVRMRFWRIENWSRHPVAVQREVLQELVTAAQHTALGKKYKFSNLFTLKEFKKNVPIHSYEDIKPYVERMMEGEENILWNTPINWFAKSSGTTADKSKFIPISEESLQDNHFKASKDVLTSYYNNFPGSDLLTGKSLVVGGSHQLNKMSEEIQYGDLSAVLMQNTPFWGQWLRTPELSIALLDEWEEKIEQLRIRISLAESMIERFESEMDGENDDDLQERIDEMNERIEELNDEITEIEENPDGDYPEDKIEEAIENRMSDVRYDVTGFMEDFGLNWEDYIDKDEFIEGVIDADGYGHTLNGYDGNADEMKVGDKWYYVMRLD
jgi:hypothetical protein